MINILKTSFFSLFFATMFVASSIGQTTRSQSSVNQIIEEVHTVSFFKDSIDLRCGLQDKSGNLWFGTYSNGLYCYNPLTHLSKHFTIKNGLPFNEIQTIFSDREGNIWFAKGGKICFYNGSKFTTISVFEISKFDALSSLGTTSSYGTSTTPSSGICCIYQDKSGDIWFGAWGPTDDAGAYRYDGKTTTHVYKGAVQSIQQDDAGHMWFDLNRYDGKTFTYMPAQQGFKPNFVFCSIKDKYGNLWFGLRSNGPGGGLLRWDGKSLVHFGIEDGLCDDYITFLYEDKAGKIWIGTSAGASRPIPCLCYYDGKTFINFNLNSEHRKKQTNTLTNFNAEKNRIPTTPILVSVFGDNTGTIWYKK